MKIDVLNAFLSHVVTFVEGLSALLAIVFYLKYKSTPLKYFPILLVYVFITGLLGVYISRNMGPNNVVIYNVFNVIYFLFFYYVFYNVIRKIRYRNWIVIGICLFLLSSIINLFYENFLFESQLLSYAIGAVVLLFCIILYFIEVLTTSRILLVNQEIVFWISIGLLLFYVGYLPIKFTRNVYAFESANTYSTLRMVHLILVILMNTCFIIGFLWTKKK
ncbi:hypothetical protein [Cochleicola gelatinilyticus]|uniref:Uncharacterized protein n=1 Tax=Cochleicola gelatinilyticus TaxID=1763537 RepID=A0A167HH01_9FLAO|nr:hypothetical protein [Cochleicola gelatinilyticus]OAB78594.1 hypothetical protein ULVI_08375 [Cochleicola gelatinilyticus]